MTIENISRMTPGRSLIPFHNQLTQVQTLGNDPQKIMDVSYLDWIAIKVPLLMHGRSEDRPYGCFAIVNSKTGNAIDGKKPVSMDFKLANNREILRDMCTFATEHELVIDWAGMLDGGRLICVHAKHAVQIDISTKAKKGDMVEAGIMMVASHQSGLVSRWLPHALRLVCTNGMTCGEDLKMSTYRLPHRGEGYDKTTVDIMFQQMAEHFKAYTGVLTSLAKSQSSEHLNKAFMVELMQPNLFTQVLEETAKRIETPRYKLNIDRNYYLDALVSQDAVQELLDSQIQQNASRTTQTLLDLCIGQPGQEFVAGSLAAPYHAVTHWVDHYRGHTTNNPSAAVEGSLMGIGQRIKQDALVLAREYQGFVGQFHPAM